MIINGYELLTELDNKNSGFSKWAFARKNGKTYFIKELLEPIYPFDRSAMTPEMFEKKERMCWDFEERFTKFYRAINNASHGNLVRIEEFFRCESHYYVTMEKIPSAALKVDQIASLNNLTKFVLLRSVAYAFLCLHNAHITHFDVKPNNIMIQETESGYYSVKIIDFDGGFFLDEPPHGEELGGDPTYLAPETFLAMIGEDVRLDEKSDIFSLGLVMHEFFTGDLPTYNRDEFDYLYEMALENGGVEPDKSSMPPILADCIRKMLRANPAERPSAKELLDLFTKIIYGDIIWNDEIKNTATETDDNAGWFVTPGDL